MRTFEELGIAPEICRAIKEMGFEHPMPVQEEVIPEMLATQETLLPWHKPEPVKQQHLNYPLFIKLI